MPPNSSIAAAVLQLLRKYPDAELQAMDLLTQSGGQLLPVDVDTALAVLFDQDLVVRQVDDDGSVWWAVSALGLRRQPRPEKQAPEPTTVAAMSPTVATAPLAAVDRPAPATVLQEVHGEPPTEAAPKASRSVSKPPDIGIEVHKLAAAPSTRHARTTPVARSGHVAQDALSVLSAPNPPAVVDLIELIHRVNPTNRDVEPATRIVRYQLKHRLQSLLIRHYAEEIAVKAQAAGAEVVGLGHQRTGRDACHAIVADLDDDARSWVQWTLDTRTIEARAPQAVQPTVKQLAVDQDSVEDWLGRAAELLAEYDYDGAQDAFRQAFTRSGGSPGTAVPLLEFLVDALADHAGALDCLPGIDGRARQQPQVRALLALAAAHTGDAAQATKLVPDVRALRVAETWTLIAQLELRSGHLDAARLAARRARESAVPTPGLVDIEAQIAQVLAAGRRPHEERLQALIEAGDEAGAMDCARQMVADRLDSPLARRMLRQAEERAAAAQRAASEARAQAAEREREARALAQVAEVCALLDAGERLQAWQVCLDMDPPRRARVEQQRPAPAWAWLRLLEAAEVPRATSLKAVAAAADLGEATPEMLATLCMAHPALRHVPEFRRAETHLETARETALRESVIAALAQVEQLILTNDLVGAQHLLDSLQRVPSALSAAHKDVQHKLSAMTWQTEQHAKLDEACANERWDEAQEHALALLQRGGTAAQVAHWQASLTLAQDGIAAAHPAWRDETPHVPRIPIPPHSQVMGAPALVHDGLALSAVVRGGWLFLELTHVETAHTVSRSVVKLTHHVPASGSWNGRVLNFATADGDLLEVDVRQARVLRRRRLQVGPGEFVQRFFAVDEQTFWHARLHVDRAERTRQLLTREELRPIWTSAAAGLWEAPVAGLQPPGWFDVHGDTRGAVLTPRGRTLPVEFRPAPWRTMAVAVSPEDPRRIVSLGSAPQPNEVWTAPSLARVFLVAHKGPGMDVWQRIQLPPGKPMTVATSRSAECSYVVQLDASEKVTKLSCYAFGALGPTLLYEAQTANASTLLTDAQAEHLYLWRDVAGRVEIHRLGREPPPECASGPGQTRRLQPGLRWLDPCPDKTLAGIDDEQLFRGQHLGPDRALAALQQQTTGAARVSVLVRLSRAGDDAGVQAAHDAMPQADRMLPCYRLWCAQDVLKWGELEAAMYSLTLTDPEAWSPVEIAHRHHLKAAIALRQGDWLACHEALEAVGLKPAAASCGCETAEIAAMADAQQRSKDGHTDTWLASELAAIARADVALAAAQPKAALQALAGVPYLHHPQAQTLARVVEAALAPAEEGADPFWTGLVCATLLDSLMERHSFGSDALVVPGAHWPRARLQALAARGRAWLEQNLLSS